MLNRRRFSQRCFLNNNRTFSQTWDTDWANFLIAQMADIWLDLFLSAAIGHRTRNYLSCCSSWTCCSPFGSFPHINEISFKNFLLVSGIEPLEIDFYISPQTLDQYWSTLVFTKLWICSCDSRAGFAYLLNWMATCQKFLGRGEQTWPGIRWVLILLGYLKIRLIKNSASQSATRSDDREDKKSETASNSVTRSMIYKQFTSSYSQACQWISASLLRDRTSH